ncbi:hypothetical protein [Micavibrio aeruginosavorus]|uniref:hypothetical protein n=1 Tax=Micavibrio aeruginosavorus TaxID=349221 RepID=UPI00034B0C40|nr:hypothetical protein [Micavibrio aeruginosavorus]
MATLLPRDSDNTPIPAVRLKSGGAHALTAGATSSRNATAFDDDTRIVSVCATAPVYIAFGDATVVATTADHYFPANLYYDFCIGGDRVAHYTHMAVLRVGAEDCAVYVSEKE